MADEPIAQSALDKPEVAEAPAPVTAAAETAAMNKRLATQTDVDITMGGTAADNGDSVHVSTTEVPNDETASTPSTAKKNQKRKSSGGIPEHKGKKLNHKKSMPNLHLSAQPGEHWYVRMRGFPPWPAIICDEEMLPISLLSKRPVSAAQPNGTYREDFREGGKNARDRRYPVMFLGTNEFAWQVNTELEDLDIDEIKNAVANSGQKKMSNSLWEAYQIAAEHHDLQYFKEMLREHEQRRVEEAQAAADAAAEKEAKKEAKKELKKSKSKSKLTNVDDDVEMVDASDEPSQKAASKKRKKESDESTPKLKLKLKAAAEEQSPKPKKARKAKPAADSEEEQVAKPRAPEVQLTPAEKLKKREKTILYLRHRLQKGLISRESPPKAEEMDALADHLTTLEGYTDLEPEIIRDTKANKLLKVILKLATIPRDEEFKFKQRCKVLLDTWTKVLQSDEEKGVKVNGGSAINGVDKDKKDGVKLGTTAGEEPTPSVETETTPAANGHGDKDAPLESVETAPGKLEADAPAVVEEGVSAPA